MFLDSPPQKRRANTREQDAVGNVVLDPFSIGIDKVGAPQYFIPMKMNQVNVVDLATPRCSTR